MIDFRTSTPKIARFRSPQNPSDPPLCTCFAETNHTLVE